jgi:hypothetical protein
MIHDRSLTLVLSRVLTECAREYAARGSAERGKRTSTARIRNADAERGFRNDANGTIRKALRTTLPIHSLAGDDSGLPQTADAHYASGWRNVKSVSNIFLCVCSINCGCARSSHFFEIEKKP